jgi:hypothetical protein
MVADLLRQSLIQHMLALDLRRVRAKESARVALALARDYRLEALAKDPNRSDPAWAAERVPHDTMMAFYGEQLGRT